MSDLTEIKKIKDDGLCCGSEYEEHYPYGTCLNLHDELVDELGLSQLAVGDEVMIRATAFVKSRSEYQEEDQNSSRSDKSVGLQLTAIKVNREVEKDRVKRLYGDNE